MGLEIEKIKRKLPESYSMNFETRSAKKNPNVSFNLPQNFIGNLLRVGDVRGPQTNSTASSL